MANGSDVYDWDDGNDDDLDFRSARYALQRGEVAIAVVEHFQMTQDSPGNDTVETAMPSHYLLIILLSLTNKQ